VEGRLEHRPDGRAEEEANFLRPLHDLDGLHPVNRPGPVLPGDGDSALEGFVGGEVVDEDVQGPVEGRGGVPRQEGGEEERDRLG